MELELGIYEHFKGGRYEVIGVARDCEEHQRRVVVYKALQESAGFPAGTIWTRSLEDFLGEKDLGGGKTVKRFNFVTK